MLNEIVRVQYVLTKLLTRKVQIDSAYHNSQLTDLIACEIDIE